MTDEPSFLRAVPDPERQVDGDALMEKGSRVAREARELAVTAMRKSLVNNVIPGSSFTFPDLQRLRGQAREAQAAWAKVDRELTDLLDDLNQYRRGKAGCERPLTT